MKCSTFKLPGGGFAIVCAPRQRRKRCSFCGDLLDVVLCDWKVKGGTCDKPACRRCTLHVGIDKDICPDHQPAYRAWKARQPTEAPTP